MWFTRLLHLGWGFAFYIVFQAWGILGETTAPDAPKRNAPGAASFAFGQSIAITGLLALAMLCGRILFQEVQTHGVETLALWCAGFLFLAEGLAAAFDLPLVTPRDPIERLDFAAGRNLILRHSSPLFLGLATTSTWLGPATSSMIAGGSILGWGCTQMLGGSHRHVRLAITARRAAAVLGIGMAMVLLRAAWKWTF